MQIKGTVKKYVFMDVNQIRFLDWVAKTSDVAPVGWGLGERSPYVLFLHDDIMPLVEEWDARMEVEQLREY